MLPIAFAESNRVFTKPDSMTDEQCMDLPVWQGKVPHDEAGNTYPAFIACWRLSKEDLEEIQKTGVVWVSITGHCLPPHSLFTENPFTNTPL